MVKQKPVGWRGEPGRHALAAKGIKSGRKMSRNSSEKGQTINVRAVNANVAEQRAITRIQKSMGAKRNRTHKIVVSRVKWNRRAVKQANLRSYRVIWHLVRR